MGDLSVTVRLNGILVDNRVIPVHSVVRIGESADAVVHFPGADVAVVRLGKRLAMRGRTLDEGEEMEISLGATHVHLRHTTKFRPPSALRSTIDTRFLVAAALVMVMGSWVDAAEYWLDHQPRDEGATPIAQLLQVFEAVQSGAPGPLSTAMTPSESLLEPEGEGAVEPVSINKADGPRHVPDQQASTDYYEWYRSVVLTDNQVEDASVQFLRDQEDPAARQVLALDAYSRDDYESAAWHYQWIVDHFPADRAARIRLARAEKRLGYHTREVEHYRAVLSADSTSIEARAGLAVALTRLGRLDEAAEALDILLVSAPHHPITLLAVATITAMKGQEAEAGEALEAGFLGRAQLSQELQIEMRRDIALDPAFKTMRSSWWLRGMLTRHLGGAAPRPFAR
ncbi:MAG: Flp pilus assembly protein TadD [Myxococcota bacterium]|jgi:Flp pilus assembly protein TadD